MNSIRRWASVAGLVALLGTLGSSSQAAVMIVSFPVSAAVGVMSGIFGVGLIASGSLHSQKGTPRAIWEGWGMALAGMLLLEDSGDTAYGAITPAAAQKMALEPQEVALFNSHLAELNSIRESVSAALAKNKIGQGPLSQEDLDVLDEQSTQLWDSALEQAFPDAEEREVIKMILTSVALQSVVKNQGK